MKAWRDPLFWLLLLGFGLPFVLQAGVYPFQKLSMFSEDPSAYVRFSSRLDSLPKRP